MHPPYSDLAPSENTICFDLYRTLLMVKLILKEACENHLSQFFDHQKSQKFYSDGIMVLLQKWQKVVKQNDTYLV